VIELRQSLRLRGHEASAVEHAQHRLIALLLILARDEFLPARGRLPIDGAIVVVALVVAQGFWDPLRERQREIRDMFPLWAFPPQLPFNETA
jgi:type II secretory pathway component PulM